MNGSTRRKLLRSACHAAVLTSWTVVTLGMPIAAAFLSDDELVRDSAKEALNFTISMYLWGAICTGLMFTIIGIPAALFGMVIFGIVGAIFPIIAIFSVCVDPEKPFRYPFTIRFFRSNLTQVNATASKQVIAK